MGKCKEVDFEVDNRDVAGSHQIPVPVQGVCMWPLEVKKKNKTAEKNATAVEKETFSADGANMDDHGAEADAENEDSDEQTPEDPDVAKSTTALVNLDVAACITPCLYALISGCLGSLGLYVMSKIVRCRQKAWKSGDMTTNLL